jgi:hypothetical protein
MKHLTAPRVAVLAASAALAAESASPSPLVAFYVIAVSAAALIGSAFLAYLAAIDEPSPRSLAGLATIGLAGGMVMAEAAMRFPMMLSARAPAGPGTLVIAAVTLTALGLLTELPALPARVPRPHASALRELLSR